MPGYRVREIEHAIGSHAYRLRVLVDTQQFADPDGHSARIGISSAQWSLFGQVWPAGRLLAQAMHRFDIDGKRIMELGCGIGLASLVLKRRGADVVATDAHPLAEVFLRLLPGTILTRISDDVEHRVLVRGSHDFEYQGQRFKSLSAIAGHITGSHWSGPVFFGLKSPTSKKVMA